jgi:hypothetical protein
VLRPNAYGIRLARCVADGLSVCLSSLGGGKAQEPNAGPEPQASMSENRLKTFKIV